ncbi:MAG: helix-turn-helix domain-containing protein [Acidimicrobiales bacterium]
MAAASRRRALEEAGLVHARPEAVTATLFHGSQPFFLPEDKVQVKYEMLRSHLVDGEPVTTASAAHGYSRAAFYLVASAFSDAGMSGLLDERRGRRGPLKISPEIAAFILDADPVLSGAEIAALVASEYGVSLHRRTVERARRR